jgi:hypothetical protein
MSAPATSVTQMCTNPSLGGIFSCLFCVALFAFIGYNSSKKNNGSMGAMQMFFYFYAVCYCLSTLGSIFNYFTAKPCSTAPAPAPAGPAPSQ